MEKLIELLNEYKWKEERTIECGCPHNDWYWAYTYEHEELIIISKKFWFIQWLVENKKVNMREDGIISLASELWEEADYETLLMLLSIKDNPIGFLISILK